MSLKWIKRIAMIAVLAVLAGIVVYALRPAPLSVDVAVIERGALAVTVDEEGVARIRDVFRVSAPLAGTLKRLPVNVGDTVTRTTTVVATIEPAAPTLLDARTRREFESTAGAARAAVSLAEAQVRGAEAAQRLARSDVDRTNRLAAGGTVSERTAQQAATEFDTAVAAVEQARATLNLRRSELDSAEARLMDPADLAGKDGDCCVPVTAPADGVVLKLIAESEQVVPAGAPLVEVGNPANLEVVVRLLSSDAVGVKAGAVATLTDWGGLPLNAWVRRIDPAAYTKVSALGIEEQRVDVRLELTDPPELWSGLGHDFRVMVHIRTWRGADVTLVPIGALFRRGTDWSVFRVADGVARATPVIIGHRNATAAEVTSGLSAGDTVVLHPSDRVVDGVSVAPRP
ncbi:HlyD family efflux transporter periplasmic adaptor subunit [soil metagenome]